MPAVLSLELTANDAIITQPGYLVVIGYRVHVHTCFRQLSLKTAFMHVPQEPARADEDHLTRRSDRTPKLLKPLSNLRSVPQLPSRHVGSQPKLVCAL